jgi:hypothetical protein
MVLSPESQTGQSGDPTLAVLLQRKHEEAERERQVIRERKAHLLRQRLWLAGLILVVVILAMAALLFISPAL